MMPHTMKVRKRVDRNDTRSTIESNSVDTAITTISGSISSSHGEKRIRPPAKHARNKVRRTEEYKEHPNGVSALVRAQRTPAVSRTRFGQFCDETTIHGMREFNDKHMHLIARLFWAIVFLSICGVFCHQVYTLSLKFYNEETTTDFDLLDTTMSDYQVRVVCVKTDRMLHSTWRQYGITPAAARYLDHQWFAYLLDSDSLAHKIESTDIRFDEYEFYTPYSDTAFDETTWDAFRSHLTTAIEESDTAFRKLVESNATRYSMNVTQMYDITNPVFYTEGGVLPISTEQTVVRGPYASVGTPHLVCWDIESDMLEEDGGATMKVLIRVYADQAADKGKHLVYYTDFMGDHDIFDANYYNEIEYPSNQNSTKETWIRYTNDITLIEMQDRRTKPCQTAVEVNRQAGDREADLLRYPYNGHIIKCLDDCMKKAIGKEYDCNYNSETMIDLCHQYHITKKLATLTDWRSFITDESLQSMADVVENGQIPPCEEAFGHCNTTQKNHFIVALLFRQVYLTAIQSCNTTCEGYNQYCDIYKFYHSGSSTGTSVAYKEGQRGVPNWDMSGHSSQVDRFDIIIEMSPLKVYSVFKQLIRINTEGFVSDLGGVSGFYLGASIFTVLHLIFYWVLTPCLDRTQKEVVDLGTRMGSAIPGMREESGHSNSRREVY